MSRPGLLVTRRLVAVEPRPLPHGFPARPIDSASATAAGRFRGVLTAGMAGTRTLIDAQETEPLAKRRLGRVRSGGMPSNEAWRVAA